MPLNSLQAFINELIEIGQVEWLKDFHTSPDKKPFLTKVFYFAGFGPVMSAPPLTGVADLLVLVPEINYVFIHIVE